MTVLQCNRTRCTLQAIYMRLPYICASMHDGTCTFARGPLLALDSGVAPGLRGGAGLGKS